MSDTRSRLPAALLFLRASVFLVMAMWTVDKFVRPDHAAKVFGAFYFLPGVGRGGMFAVAVAETALLVVFVLGVGRRWSYGLVTFLHGVSTLSSFRQYLNPFEGANLLFFAAWPMLAACWTLYVLRDEDTLLAVDK